MPAKKVCFFITPIGQPKSPERDRADKIKKHLLNRVLAGKYKVVRVDELRQPGSITHQIIELLNDADLVIADLTGLNPNVFYELAIRHALNKVSVHLIDKNTKIPFDLQDERTIIFNINDLDSVNECKQQLAKFVQEINRKKFEYSSPVFRVLGVAAATEEEQREFLDTMAGQIDSIASDVSSIELELGMADLDEIGKSLSQLGKDAYDMKLDIQKILDHLK